MELPQHWGRFGEPAADGVRAQLILALLLCALAPMLVIGRPLEIHKVMLEWRPPEADAGILFHRLVLTPNGEMLFDGEAVDYFGLRKRLDLLAVSGREGVDFRPHPEARYEDFLEMPALTRRAMVEHLRLDNDAYAGALGPAAAPRMRNDSR